MEGQDKTGTKVFTYLQHEHDENPNNSRLSPKTRVLIDRMQHGKAIKVDEPVLNNRGEFEAPSRAEIQSREFARDLYGDIHVFPGDLVMPEPILDAAEWPSPSYKWPENEHETARPPPPLEVFPMCDACGKSSCGCSAYNLKELSLPKAIYTAGYTTTVGVAAYAFLKAVTGEDILMY